MSDSFLVFLLSGAVLFVSSAAAAYASSRDAIGFLALAGVLFAGSLLATVATAKGVIDYVYFHKGTGIFTVALVLGISFMGFFLAKTLKLRLLNAPALLFAMIGLLCVAALLK